MTWDLSEFQDKDVVCIGQAREGESFERFIRTHAAIRSFRFADQKDDPEYLEKLKDLDPGETVIVKSAGVPGRLVPVPYTTPTNIFFKLIKSTPAVTVGITATKGKSTTASLLSHILTSAGKKAILCGNIGLPMLDYVDQATPEIIFVIELGAYQAADMVTSPHISVVTNIYNDHLPYFGDSEAAYQEAKHNMMRHGTAEDYFVYNPDFPLLETWAKEAASQSVAIDLNEPIDISKSGLIGQHNELNARAARVAARLLGVSDDQIQAAIDTFPGIEHRLETVATIDMITYVDDAIGSQPEATIAGLKAVTEHIGPVGCLFLGGEDRHYDFGELIALITKLQIPNLVLFPDTGERIKAALPPEYQPNILETRDMKEAVAWAAKQAPPPSVVLLSTAAPSYSLWKDFEEKGNLFKQAVLALK